MQKVEHIGQCLIIIIIRIKGAAVVMVTVEFFPVEVLGEVTQYVVGNIRFFFCRT